jgi:hypothetical protein
MRPHRKASLFNALGYWTSRLSGISIVRLSWQRLSGAVTRRANFELAHANISQQISLERTGDIGI